jgi:hypothetical protein
MFNFYLQLLFEIFFAPINIQRVVFEMGAETHVIQVLTTGFITVACFKPKFRLIDKF